MKKTKPSTTPPTIPGFSHVKSVAGIEEYVLKSNGLRVLYCHRPETGVVTTNITYLVGSKDEARGETGVAHMLEHMLFKTTESDVAAGVDSSAMKFERETGCILNANTWKDRTTYYFSFPKEQFSRVVRIEAERMNGVILTDQSLAPERSNVLSEFNMRNGDPYFGLDVAMIGTAFHSHPYGHETIGYKEDIEKYTAAKLESFYRAYYRPDNAIMMVVGDVEREVALKTIKKYFTELKKPADPIFRYDITEFKQEGLRRVSVERPSSTNIISLGFKHAPFPSPEWFTVSALLEVLTAGPESVLHLALVDSGIATDVSGNLEPTSQENLGMLIITLAQNQDHHKIESMVLKIIADLSTETITPLLKKIKARQITDELFARDSSLRIVEELTEYSAGGDWTTYTKTVEILSSITPKSVHQAAKQLFVPNNMTIGYFIGTQE